MRVMLWAWHTPYIWTLAKAMPEVTFCVNPTPYCPFGWNYAHRPLPPNVVFATREAPDVMICQTEQDFHAIPEPNEDGPALIFLGHNLPRFESPALIKRLNFLASEANDDGAYVSISLMKSAAWQEVVPGEKWHTILPGIPLDEFAAPWTGEGGYILTVANNLSRPLFDKAAWLEATRGLPVKLVGSGNEGILGAVGPAESWDHLKSLYRCAAVYLSVNKWPVEDSHNLALLEAMATGTPCVALRSKGQEQPPPCVWAWGADALRMTVEMAQAMEIPLRLGAHLMREVVTRDFPLATFRQKWLDVLESVTA